MNRPLQLFLYECGLGAADPACAQGPRQLAPWLWLDDDTVPVREYRGTSNDPVTAIAGINRRLAVDVKRSLSENRLPLLFGGDHSSAIGFWSGVQSALNSGTSLISATESRFPLGLLWMDAHMDSHTFQSSPSGNIHGMPLAALLGHGDSRLVHINEFPLHPGQVVLFGVRSYEAAEHRLLRELGVTIYFQEQIERDGLQRCFRQALARLCDRCANIGISMDWDVLDPVDFPAVGSREAGGIAAGGFLKVLDELAPLGGRLCALEFAEYNPELDMEGKSNQWIQRIVKKSLSLIAQKSLS